MANSKVPKFGAWAGEEDVAYTVYFDHARKNKNQGMMINPNDPQLNRDMNQLQNPTARPDRVAEETNLARQNNRSRRSSNQQGSERGGGQLPTEPQPKPSIQSVVSDASNSIGRSPLHPRASGRGVSGPSSFDSKHPSDSAHGTPGRSRPRSTSQTSDRGTSVPEFGAWNKDPGQAEGYTDVFEQLGKDRRGGETPNDRGASHVGTSKQHPNDEVKGCCFWFK